MFAEMINRTFKPIHGVVIKISSIRGTTVLFRQDGIAQIGLEMAEDIYESDDLDKVYSDSNDKNRFFEHLIFKKLIEADNYILNYSEKNPSGEYTYIPQEGFIRAFFKESGLFDELVEASGRIPRLFVEMFYDISTIFDFRIHPKWDRPNIMEEIIDRSAVKRRDIARHPKLGNFYERACKIVGDTGQRIFLVPHDDMILLAEPVSNLFHFKMIHNLDRAKLPGDIDRTYRAYYVDYGTYLEITSKHQERNYQLEDINYDSCQFLDNIDMYIIRSSDVQLNVGVCGNCTRAVALDHPAVINARVCPLCWQPLKIAGPTTPGLMNLTT